MVVKICGIRTPAQALTAARAGADIIGLVFAPARRQVSIDDATAIVAALRAEQHGLHPVLVCGVFLADQQEQMNAIIETSGIDYVQIHGELEPEQLAGLRAPVMKSLRMSGSRNEQRWMDWIATSESGIMITSCPLHVDAHGTGAYGGTGVLADWNKAADLARQFPLMLAGGLTPDNVAAAIAAVHPWGVDVSSGVERDGVKDPTLIEQFIKRSNQAVS